MSLYPPSTGWCYAPPCLSSSPLGQGSNQGPSVFLVSRLGVSWSWFLVAPRLSTCHSPRQVPREGTGKGGTTSLKKRRLIKKETYYYSSQNSWKSNSVLVIFQFQYVCDTCLGWNTNTIEICTAYITHIVYANIQFNQKKKSLKLLSVLTFNWLSSRPTLSSTGRCHGQGSNFLVSPPSFV